MKNLNSLLSHLAAIAAAVSPVLAQPLVQLDGAKGHIHKVDLEQRCFELLKETEYDPKTDIGRSRFTVFWDQNSKAFTTLEKKDFSDIKKPVLALFQGIDAANRKSLKLSKAFEARVVTLYPDPGLAADLATDDNQVLGMFTPDLDEGLRFGHILVDGERIRVNLRQKHWRIWVKQPRPLEVINEGFWKATLSGRHQQGRFVVERMEIDALPDPRLSDDPKLPRVLVIGDSISMNYHEAAKEALKGVANYHRCEGNCFTTAHGVRNAELWMGEYRQPGFHWDVIHFNHGLHDLKQAYDKETDKFGAYAVSLEEYQANLEKLIGLLRQSGAKLIWCSTTPVPNDRKGPYARCKGAAKVFNAAALEVIKRHPDIAINDLHGLIDSSPLFDEWRKGSDVHFFKEAERAVIGKAVAATISEALQTGKKSAATDE